jgi:hypothetical protein
VAADVTPTELYEALDPYQATVPRLVAERFEMSERRAERLLGQLASSDRMVVARGATDTPVWVRRGPG